MFPRHGTEAFDMVTQCVLFVMLEAAKKATHGCVVVCRLKREARDLQPTGLVTRSSSTRGNDYDGSNTRGIGKYLGSNTQ